MARRILEETYSSGKKVPCRLLFTGNQRDIGQRPVFSANAFLMRSVPTKVRGSPEASRTATSTARKASKTTEPYPSCHQSFIHSVPVLLRIAASGSYGSSKH